MASGAYDDCAACHHVALLTLEVLIKAGLSNTVKVLDLKDRLRCRGCGAKGRAVVLSRAGNSAHDWAERGPMIRC